jgi:hypothetical protein
MLSQFQNCIFNGNLAKWIIFHPKIFPEIYTDRVFHAKVLNGGDLIAVSEADWTLNIDPTLIIFKNVCG